MSLEDSAGLTVKLSADLHSKLDALAGKTRRSKADLAAEAIAAYLDLSEWQLGEIEAGIAELEAGDSVSQDEADGRYERLLRGIA